MTRKGALRVGAAATLLAGVIWLADPATVLQAIRGVDGDWFALGASLAILSNIVSALRWRALSVWLGQRLAATAAVTLYFRAVALNALLPGAVVGGDVYRMLSLRRTGQPALEAGLSVMLDRLSGLWMLLIIGALACAAGAAGGSPLLPANWPGAPALGVLALLLWVAPLPALAFARRVAGRLRARAQWAERVACVAHLPAPGRQFLLQSVASALVQWLSIAAFALGGRALGVDLPAWAWAAAAAPTFLMAALPVSFGGWGTREAAAGVCLGAFGVPVAQAVGVSVLYGLFGVLQALAGSIVFALARPPAPACAPSDKG
jgi:glycosyltransferase 2 family protein